MRWPDDTVCKRIKALWAHAYNQSSNRHESENALSALKRLQADEALSDAELAFIAESHIDFDDGDTSDQPPDLLQLILHLFHELHIIFPTFELAFVVALWTLHAVVFDRFLHTPRLLLQSSEPGCGETALMMCLEQLISGAFYSDDVTPATIYYQLQDEPRTAFLLDEIENSALWASDRFLLRVCDAGHRRGGRTTRTIPRPKGAAGANRVVVRFPCFAPMALAGVAEYQFPAQLLSRSIKGEMEKKPEGRDELDENDSRCTAVRGLISEWASGFKRPENCRIPFTGRDADNWRPLIEIAETLGYGETARAAALVIHQPSDDPVVRLLFDILQIFEQRGVDRIWTGELLQALHELPNAKWDEFWGLQGDKDPHKLTRSELYRMLKKKKIYSHTVWKGKGVERKSSNGFLREQFEPIWRQLFPDTPAQSSKVIALTRHKKQHTGGTDDTEI